MTSTCSCPEFTSAAVSRRGLFRGAALAGATSVFGTTVVTTSRAEAATPAAAVMVVLSLRGAADGLSLVVPHADPAYYAARPSIAVPRTSLLAQDSFFGLHPALAPLLPLWESQKLAAVHATGLPVANRSHFSAMEALEDADPGSPERTGWLNRLVGQDADASVAQGLHLGGSIPPASMAGPTPVMTMSSLSALRIPGGEQTLDASNPRLRSLGTIWNDSTSAYGAGLRDAISGLKQLLPAESQPDRTSTYPNSSLGRALAAVARTLRADVGVATVTVDQGDWDMHADVGTTRSGRMLNNTRDLATSLAAFFADLGPVADKVTVVTISEFGRRVAENANRGLDHGWGNVMLLAGAGVKGGRYYGTWPGLTNSLDADLRVTTDYRSVLSEVVTTRMGASSAAVFPGFRPETVGVMSSL